MKITHLNTYTEGGAAEASLRIHTSLLQAGINSKYIALYKGRCNLKEVYDFRDELNSVNYWYTKIKNKQKTISDKNISEKAGELFSQINSVWRVEQHTLIKTADIVHLHWISNFVNIPTFIKTNKKVVWTLHDLFLFSGGFHYPPVNKGVVSETIISNQLNTLKELFYNHPIDIVCPSKYLMDLAQNSGVLSKCSFHIVKNPVDTSVFKPLPKSECKNRLKTEDNRKVLFFISDYIDYTRKGFPILKEALELLDEEVTLIVAGRGKLPSRIGKANVIHFGLVKDKNLLNDLYNAADVLVNPSLDDISSNTVIEAASCGVPSVTFNSGGIPELISSTNGIIAAKKTPAELAKSINLALKTNFDSALISAKAKQDHCLETIAQQYISIYKKILGK